MKPEPSVAHPTLARVIGPLTAAAIVVGTVIGSGVFKKPSTVALNVPYFGLALSVWIVTGLFVILGSLAYAEVAVLYPRAGGNYVFLREAYGRLAGFLWGWVEFWIIRSASIAALATVFTESLHDVLRIPAFQEAVGLAAGDVLGFWPRIATTVAMILVLALVNVRGVRWGGGLQVGVTFVKIGSLLAILALPVVALLIFGSGSPAAPTTDNLQPTWPQTWDGVLVSGLGSAFLGVWWAYHGWMNIAPVAEEVRRPQRDIPLALLTGVGLVMFLYVGANVAYYLILSGPEMAALQGTTTATAFTLRILGPLGAAAASAAVMCSVFGALNGNLLVGPRLLFAMGRDGLAPQWLQDLHPRFGTPVAATVVLAAWSCVLVIGVALLTVTGVLEANTSHFDALTNFAMFGSLTFETLAIASIFVFRYRYPAGERPYRCLGYPVTPLLYVLLPGFVLFNMAFDQQLQASAGVGFIVLGMIVYFVLGLGRRQPHAAIPTDPANGGPPSDQVCQPETGIRRSPPETTHSAHSGQGR
jgi:amino acid transporter